MCSNGRAVNVNGSGLPGTVRNSSTPAVHRRRFELAIWILEAPPGFEPGMEVLQTSALPLGDGAGWNCGRKEDPAASSDSGDNSGDGERPEASCACGWLANRRSRIACRA